MLGNQRIYFGELHALGTRQFHPRLAKMTSALAVTASRFRAIARSGKLTWLVL